MTAICKEVRIRVFDLCTVLVISALAATASFTAAAADKNPLPSWNNTPARQALIGFVEKVTRNGSPEFVPPAERIAVFDNDGTLWPENPVPFQLAYALDTLKQMVKKEPSLEKDSMVKAALAGKHHDGLLHIFALTHAGMQ